MKKNLIAVLGMILFSMPVAATENYECPPTSIEQFDTEKYLQKIVETAKYFDDHYPQEKINEDMTDDIKKFFPDISEQTAFDLQDYVRESLSLYRYITTLYNKYKEKLLTPDDPPVIVDDDEYAQAPAESYIDNGDQALIVTDIKTIVPYSGLRRDIDAAESKIIRDLNQDDEAGDLLKAVANMELKKFFLYDAVYPNPQTGNKGKGKRLYNNGISVRLLSAQTGVKQTSIIKGAIDVDVEQGKVIIANNGQYLPPQINFDHSENLKFGQAILPVPNRIISADNRDISVYTGSFLIPMILEIEDENQALTLRTEIEFTVCGRQSGCQNVKLQPQLTIGTEKARRSAVYINVNQSHLHLPKPTIPELKVDDIYIKSISPNEDYIDINLSSTQKVSAFATFISSADRLEFEAPRVSIDGKKINVKFLPIDKNADLRQKTFELTFGLNNSLFMRDNYTPKLSLSDNRPVTSSHLITRLIKAFFGGLLMNFMPAGLAIWLIKILGLTTFGANRPETVKRNFKLTIGGITSSLFVIIALLLLLKTGGCNLGWNMQLQTPYFSLFMMFLIIMVFLIGNNIFFIELPEWLKKHFSVTALSNFGSGVLAVCLAIGSYSPGLESSVGWALSQSSVSMLMTLPVAGLGFILPYWLCYRLPIIVTVIPAPDVWVHRVRKFLSFLELILFIWFAIILTMQTSIWTVVRISLYAFLFMAILYLNYSNLNNDYASLSPAKRLKARTVFSRMFLSIAGLLLVIAVADSVGSYSKHRLNVAETSQSEIDFQELRDAINNRQTVLIAVGNDVCFQCRYNNWVALDLPDITALSKLKKVKIMNIDWSKYSPQVWQFMQKYNRHSVPFYVLFSPLAPDGMVLPTILNGNDLKTVIGNFTIGR